jgi:hypothetical protein
MFACMGFYPVCPASGYYAIGAPQIPKAVMHLSNGKDFTMTAENISDQNIYVQSVKLNGKDWNSPFLPYSELKDGGTIAFTMGSQPNKSWGANPEMPAEAMNAPVKADDAAAGVFQIKTDDGKCEITINTTDATNLTDWADTTLASTLAEWYPKITALLPSDGYTVPDHFSVTIKPMDGVAYTAGRNVVANSTWLARELKGEAVGSLVHEAVHVVQQFHSRRNPGWLVEGSADYVRWFLFDADKHGADMIWFRKHGKNFSPHYNDSYRVTANFLNWVSEKYDKDIVPQMNASMRDGKYDESLWQKYTGKPLSELGAEWEKEVEAQLQSATTTALKKVN